MSLFKVNILIGAKAAFLSGFGLVAPLIGVFGGLKLSAQVLIIRSLFKLLFFAVNPLSPLLYHIPTFFASAYWTIDKSALRIGIPLLCMVLFNAHPVGAAAWVYSLYWLIPIVIAFITEKSVFAKALGSTFTAHAVGSVLWVYLMPMTSEMFILLMPVVIIERLFFASGMTILFYSINGIINSRYLRIIKNNIVTPRLAYTQN